MTAFLRGPCHSLARHAGKALKLGSRMSALWYRQFRPVQCHIGRGFGRAQGSCNLPRGCISAGRHVLQHFCKRRDPAPCAGTRKRCLAGEKHYPVHSKTRCPGSSRTGDSNSRTESKGAHGLRAVHPVEASCKALMSDLSPRHRRNLI